MYNRYRICVDIMTEKKLSSIPVAIMDIIYWSVRSSSRRGGDRVKGMVMGYHFLNHLQV